jgi:hypothetical protein
MFRHVHCANVSECFLNNSKMDDQSRNQYPSRQMRALVIIQGSYYMITALWPLIHIESYMMLVGPITDIWLAKTVATMVIAISITMFFHLSLRTDHRPLVLLGVSSSLAFAYTDVYYSVTGTLSNIYLLDAAAEFLFMASWVVLVFKQDP